PDSPGTPLRSSFASMSYPTSAHVGLSPATTSGVTAAAPALVGTSTMRAPRSMVTRPAPAPSLNRCFVFISPAFVRTRVGTLPPAPALGSVDPGGARMRLRRHRTPQRAGTPGAARHNSGDRGASAEPRAVRGLAISRSVLLNGRFAP